MGMANMLAYAPAPGIHKSLTKLASNTPPTDKRYAQQNFQTATNNFTVKTCLDSSQIPQLKIFMFHLQTVN